MKRHVYIKVYGKVQGVFFRRTAKVEADKLAIGGWVRNKFDGSLEISASGEQQDIKNFVNWCKKGPPFAQVENVEVVDRKPEDYEEFLITD